MIERLRKWLAGKKAIIFLIESLGQHKWTGSGEDTDLC